MTNSQGCRRFMCSFGLCINWYFLNGDILNPKHILSLAPLPYHSLIYFILYYQTAAGTHQEHLVPFPVGKGPISSKTANAF